MIVRHSLKRFVFRFIERCKQTFSLIVAFCRKVKFGLTSKFSISNYKEIPIIICNYNRLKYLKALIHSLKEYGYNNVFILDNASTYPPLIEYYKKECTCQIIYLSRNYGHKALWESGVINQFNNDYFIYTDPDLVFSKDCPDNIVLFMLKKLKRHPRVDKIAASLDITDIPDGYPLKEKVLENECRFYKKMQYGCYVADVDTTFAMYTPDGSAAFHDDDFTLRTPEPYIMKHLPWYQIEADGEDKYYIEHKRKDVGWWVN